MIEKTIEVERMEHVISVFGSFDQNLRIIETELGVKVLDRENRIHVSGEPESVMLAEKAINGLLTLAAKGENIDAQNVRYILKLVAEGRESKINELAGDVICITAKGKPIKPKTLGQKTYCDAIAKNTVTLGIGPAGTGKTYLAVAAAVSLAMAVAGTRLTGRAAGVPAARADDPAPAARAMWPVFVAVLPLAIVAIAGTAVEDTGQNWAGLASVELAGVAVASAGVAYAVFLTAQTIGRFAGDRVIDAFGRARVAAAGGALIAVGGVLVVTAPAAPALIAGFALAGFGCATLVPSAFAAAAALPGLFDGVGVTLIGWLMRMGFLATSPAIGAVATGAGLSVALGILVILGVVVMACAPALRERA